MTIAVTSQDTCHKQIDVCFRAQSNNQVIDVGSLQLPGVAAGSRVQHSLLPAGCFLPLPLPVIFLSRKCIPAVSLHFFTFKNCKHAN